MNRSLVGIAAVAMMAATPAIIAAEPAVNPRVSITRDKGQVTVAVAAGSLKVTQRLTPRSFDLTVADGRDSATIAGDVEGRVRVARANRVVAFSLRDGTQDEAAAARAMLTGSRALAQFDRLVASAWGRSTKEALVFVSAHALVALLQGDSSPLRTVVSRLRSETEPRIRRAAQTSNDCWRAYERDVLQITYDLEACIQEASYSLNPLRASWCAYSYNLRASLAFIWLLDCNGY